MKRINDWVTREMARRKKQFHPREDWRSIRLWGLFHKSDISRHLRNGWLTPISEYGFRCSGWYRPSKEYWESSIKPLLTSLSNLWHCQPVRPLGDVSGPPLVLVCACFGASLV